MTFNYDTWQMPNGFYKFTVHNVKELEVRFSRDLAEVLPNFYQNRNLAGTLPRLCGDFAGSLPKPRQIFAGARILPEPCEGLPKHCRDFAEF